MKKTNIYLVRHGQTRFNAQGRIQGASDSPLTENGVNKAIELGEVLKDKDLDAIYSSDLRRAFETATYIINENKEPKAVTTMKEFREFDFGELEGHAMDDFWGSQARRYNFDLDYLMKHDFMGRYNYVYDEDDNRTAETLKQFNDRILDGMVSVSKEALENGHENIMIVAHGVTIMGIIHLLIEDYKFTDFIENTSVTKFTYDGDSFENHYISKVLK